MLKIKNYLFNENEIKYIKPDYVRGSSYPYVICVQFKDDDYFDIYFASEAKRDEELNRILKKVEEE